MANFVTTLPSPGIPSRIIDRDTGEEVSPALMRFNSVTGGVEPVSQEAANIVNKIATNPKDAGNPPQPQPQQVVQPVSQAETIKESREQAAGIAPGVAPTLPAGTTIDPKDLPATPELMISQQRSDLQPST